MISLWHSFLNKIARDTPYLTCEGRIQEVFLEFNVYAVFLLCYCCDECNIIFWLIGSNFKSVISKCMLGINLMNTCAQVNTQSTVMVSQHWFNNGLLLSGNMPLPEPMLSGNMQLPEPMFGFQIYVTMSWKTGHPSWEDKLQMSWFQQDFKILKHLKIWDLCLELFGHSKIWWVSQQQLLAPVNPL